MSDISNKIQFIEMPDGADDIPAPDTALDIPRPSEPILRRSDDPLTPKAPPPPQAAPAYTPAPTDEAEAPRTLVWIGIALAVLSALALGAWIYGYFQLDEPRTALSPWAWTGLVLGIVVPSATIVLFFLTLRALRRSESEAARLTRVTDRLLRADTAVADEIGTMSRAIREEIAGVEARLSQTRSQLDGFSAALSQQSRDLDGTTKTMAERSETIGRALTLHRQAFESLANTFDAQMESLSAQIDLQRGRLTDSTTQAESDMGAARASLEDAEARLTTTIENLTGSSRAAETSLSDAEARLSAMTTRIQDGASELDAVYERRTEHLSGLANRLSGEKDSTEQALFAQTERLGAIDAQIEITETRLTALVDHASAIQTELSERLSAIDSTLDGAEERTRRFTESLGDRVTDSLADARRDLSLMETDLRALQSRLKTAENDSFAFEVEQEKRRQSQSRRIHLQPLETDFPPVEPPRPEPARERQPDPALDDADEPTAEPLDLIEVMDANEDNALVEIPPIPEPDDAPIAVAPERDVVRRPGDLGPAGNGKSFAKGGKDKADGKSGWRWRDMLGGIDPLDAETPASAAPARDESIVRPPAGVPLSAPPSAPQLPDGSDVVARLCEVKLAPSAVVDEGTIIEAGRQRLLGGETPMVDTVMARLRDPVSHLRGVLAADLEFKLRAESFARSFAAQLNGIKDDGALRASLGTASGRAYLLCTAALRS